MSEGALNFIMWYFGGGCKRTGINPIVSKWVRWMEFKHKISLPCSNPSDTTACRTRWAVVKVFRSLVSY